MLKRTLSRVVPFQRLRIADCRSNHRSSRAKRRSLHFEPLEERTLLSLTILNEGFQAVDFTFQGTYSGQGYQDPFTFTVAPGYGTVTGNGTTTYTDQYNGAGTLTGTASGTVQVDSPFGDYTDTFSYQGGGEYIDANGTLNTTIDVFGESVPVFATLDVSELPFTVTGSCDYTYPGDWFWAEGTGSVTVTFSPTDIVPTSMSWITDGVQFEYEINGGPMPTSDRSAPVTDVGLYWAYGPNLSDILGSALSESAPIYWNQATGTASATDLNTAPAGTTYLLIVADHDGLVDESNENNNLIAIELDEGTPVTPVPDTIPPEASLSASNVTTAGEETYTFTVTYSDNVAVNVSSLDDSDLVLTGPNGFSQPATFVSVDISLNGTPRTATYSITPPDGTWDQEDDGTYTVTMQPNQVSDVSGLFVTADSLGTFVVNISSTGLGLFSGGYWFLDINRDLAWGAGDGDAFAFGWSGATPVVGDWNGDGSDDVGVYADGAWFRDIDGNRQWDSTDQAAIMYYGWAGALPVVGDWNGDGTDDVGVYNLGVWFRDVNGNQVWDGTDSSSLAYLGWSGATPTPGDWNGDHQDDVGVYCNGVWFRDVNGNNQWDAPDQAAVMYYGWDGPTPVVGDWNGDRTDDVGVYNLGVWFRDINGNNSWDATDQSSLALFGVSGMLPVVGRWAETSSPLMAAGSELTAAGDQPVLTQAELCPIVAEAIARWDAVGLDTSIIDKLTQVEFVISDLPGSYLGKAETDRIYIDSDAAGYGWFVDSTPTMDEEYSPLEAHNQLRALDSRAVDRVDLLTVVEHEFGHIAGLDDLDALVDDLMSGVLETGIRRTPRWVDVDGFFASGKTWDWHLHS